MILSCFFAALGQLVDPRFTSVLWRGVGLALVLLIAIAFALGFGITLLVPDTFALPFVGPVGGLDRLAGLGAVLALLVASVFLMVPVAAAVSALFLDEVADAVEARHYPDRPGRPLSLVEGVVDGAGLFAIMVVVSLVGLILSLFVGPLAPILLWLVNGWLLGREYFTTAARRHLSRSEARILTSRHGARIWLAGTLMAAPLSLPLISLFVPVIGAATFTHLFHRLRTS